MDMGDGLLILLGLGFCILAAVWGITWRRED